MLVGLIWANWPKPYESSPHGEASMPDITTSMQWRYSRTNRESGQADASCSRLRTLDSDLSHQRDLPAEARYVAMRSSTSTRARCSGGASPGSSVDSAVVVCTKAPTRVAMSVSPGQATSGWASMSHLRSVEPLRALHAMKTGGAGDGAVGPPRCRSSAVPGRATGSASLTAVDGNRRRGRQRRRPDPRTRICGGRVRSSLPAGGSRSQKVCRVWLKSPLAKAKTLSGRTVNTTTSSFWLPLKPSGPGS